MPMFLTHSLLCEKSLCCIPVLSCLARSTALVIGTPLPSRRTRTLRHCSRLRAGRVRRATRASSAIQLWAEQQRTRHPIRRSPAATVPPCRRRCRDRRRRRKTTQRTASRRPSFRRWREAKRRGDAGNTTSKILRRRVRVAPRQAADRAALSRQAAKASGRHPPRRRKTRSCKEERSLPPGCEKRPEAAAAPRRPRGARHASGRSRISRAGWLFAAANQEHQESVDQRHRESRVGLARRTGTGGRTIEGQAPLPSTRRQRLSRASRPP